VETNERDSEMERERGKREREWESMKWRWIQRWLCWYGRVRDDSWRIVARLGCRSRRLLYLLAISSFIILEFGFDIGFEVN
jgi:hypothetical protein